MAKVDKDTQTREYYENLEKARRREKLETDTNRQMRALGKTFIDVGWLEVRATVEKISQAIDDFRERQEQQIEADWQAESARLTTKQSKLGLTKKK